MEASEKCCYYLTNELLRKNQFFEYLYFKLKRRKNMNRKLCISFLLSFHKLDWRLIRNIIHTFAQLKVSANHQKERKEKPKTYIYFKSKRKENMNRKLYITFYLSFHEFYWRLSSNFIQAFSQLKVSINHQKESKIKHIFISNRNRGKI